MDQSSGKKIEISLMRSLKTGWAYAPSVSGKEIDILKASCRFDEDAKGGFRTTYYRFHRSERDWVVSHQSEDESWENESMDSAAETSLPPTGKLPK